MMSANAMENPSAMLLDSDEIYDDTSFDNLSIDIGHIYAILDEEPTQSGYFPDTAAGPLHCEPASRSDLEQKFQAGEYETYIDLEHFEGKGPSQLNAEGMDSKEKVGLGSEQSFSDMVDERGLPAPLHLDSNCFSAIPAQDSSNRLMLSSLNDKYPLNALGSSSGSCSQPQLQSDIEKCSVSGRSMEGPGLIPFTFAANNYFYANNEEEDNKHHEDISFRTEHEESKQSGNYISSFGMLHGEETGPLHVLPPDNFDLNIGIHDSINSSAFLDLTVEGGNFDSSSMSYRDPDVEVPDIVLPEAETLEASNATYDGSNSCLTFPWFSASDAPQRALPHLQRNSPCEMLEAREESLDISSQDVSVADLDAHLTDDLCSEYNHSDDPSLISESSTDSSPIPSCKNSTADHCKEGGVVAASEHLVSSSHTSWQGRPKTFLKYEKVGQKLQPADSLCAIRGGSGIVKNKLSRSSISADNDADICILDDISDPIHPACTPYLEKLHDICHRPDFSDARCHGTGGMGLRPYDERLTFRLALQDLSQPKSEASPPDGLLAVPLLRHQRIALSWMVQKETNPRLHCSGGILADDQGLGKTVSTIALILMERAPIGSSLVKKEDEFEALNLDDDDDDDDAKASLMKQPRNSGVMIMSKLLTKENSTMLVKSRPAAGTLVVCPTSVLRQWAEELRTKVTSKGNLSFLVYHGSNRTKDPNELAKYDVVLTTYAIVSMEVPKQPLVDKEDEEKGKQDAFGVSPALLSCKKRKDPFTSNMKNRKGTSMTDNSLLESAVRPLGRVGWFRVILDEAQSIKNHRTQVARACWGLRAKRRWCLSGTPIQNAIDDLYSYFRFLRFDPYAVYKSFCSNIKTPISRNPNNGYKKLQAVLKTIMLRRTKGTLLDGKPIITLPSKTITLKKVDFSMEEREFYSTLEAESREQFMEYEDAGTVKQNYVNILLMLLRLRQACDHPLLVKGFNSNSSQRSSMEMAKKLSRDKRIILLSCLEVSLAICTICNDSPEDAVVTVCGHVFCNQCICERLTADEKVCPSPNCKAQLHTFSVFSKGTLKGSLSDELGDDCCSGSSSFEMGHKRDNSEDNWGPHSSKIKAALEILQSLPRSQHYVDISVNKSDGKSPSSSATKLNSFSVTSSTDSSCIGSLSLQKCSQRQVSEKAIVFSQWTRMLDLLEGPLKASCIEYRRLDGTMSVASREKAIKDFNSLPEVTVIIMSLKAASLGLNLVSANHVLLLDLWWNPTTEDQAIDRAHRIGQTLPVTVSRLTVKDTVEDKILSLQEKKREMVASAFGEDESGSRQTRLTVEDLRYLFMA